MTILMTRCSLNIADCSFYGIIWLAFTFELIVNLNMFRRSGRATCSAYLLGAAGDRIIAAAVPTQPPKAPSEQQMKLISIASCEIILKSVDGCPVAHQKQAGSRWGNSM